MKWFFSFCDTKMMFCFFSPSWTTHLFSHLASETCFCFQKFSQWLWDNPTCSQSLSSVSGIYLHSWMNRTCLFLLQTGEIISSPWQKPALLLNKTRLVKRGEEVWGGRETRLPGVLSSFSFWGHSFFQHFLSEEIGVSKPARGAWEAGRGLHVPPLHLGDRCNGLQISGL